MTTMTITNADLARLRSKATAAEQAANAIRAARTPMDVTLGHSLCVSAFLQEATPKRVVELCVELQQARARIVELETEKVDAAFDREVAVKP